MFEGSLYYIHIIVKDSDEALELSIIWAEFLASLSELIELSRCSSNLIRVPKSHIKDTNEYLNLLEVNHVGKDIMLNCYTPPLRHILRMGILTK
jgi:hypothetical protein